jgi:hypothetical protein
MWGCGSAASAAVGVVAQLTGLKQLGLGTWPQFVYQDNAAVLLQLTALTALEQLTVVLEPDKDSSDSSDDNSGVDCFVNGRCNYREARPDTRDCCVLPDKVSPLVCVIMTSCVRLCHDELYSFFWQLHHAVCKSFEVKTQLEVHTAVIAGIAEWTSSLDNILCCLGGSYLLSSGSWQLYCLRQGAR